MGVCHRHQGVKSQYRQSTALARHNSYSAGVSLQAVYTQLQQHSSSQEQELAALRARSPAAAASSGPQSTDGGASSRLREMHGQLAQQDSQLASARAENQVGRLHIPHQRGSILLAVKVFHAAPAGQDVARHGR